MSDIERMVERDELPGIVPRDAMSRIEKIRGVEHREMNCPASSRGTPCPAGNCEERCMARMEREYGAGYLQLPEAS